MMITNENSNELYDFTLSEMLSVKTGWNKSFVSDEIICGYTDEMQNLMEHVTFCREPQSGFGLAYETIKTIYRTYSAVVNNE